MVHILPGKDPGFGGQHKSATGKNCERAIKFIFSMNFEIFNILKVHWLSVSKYQ